MGVMGDVMGPFDSPPMGSYYLTIDTHGLSLTVFELFNFPQRRFRPSDPPSMTITALEAIASSSGNNGRCRPMQ